jgi:hypothetical protein
MGSFPALPSASNPYVGAAAGAAGAAASVYNQAQSRKALAAQRAAQAAEKQKTDAALAAQRAQQASQEQGKNEQWFAEHNYVPSKVVNTGQSIPGQPGMKDEDAGGLIDNPNADPDSEELNEAISGRGYRKAKLNDTNSFPLNDQIRADAKELGIDLPQGNARVPLTLLQRLHEAQQVHTALHPPETFASPQDHHFDENGQPVFLQFGNRGTIQRGVLPGSASNLGASLNAAQPGGVAPTAQPAAPTGGGTPGGAFDLGRSIQQFPFTAPQAAPTQPSQPPAQATAARPAGGVHFALPTKPEKADSQIIIPGKKGPNGGVIVWNKLTKSMEELPLPAGSSDELTPAQKEADKDRHITQGRLAEDQATRLDAAAQRRADAQQAIENKAAKDHEAAGLKKEAMQAMAQGYYDAEGTPAGGTYFQPRYQNGLVVPGTRAELMPTDEKELAARRADLHKLGQGFDRTAATHQAEQKRIEKARGWGEFAPQQGAPAQGGAASPAGNAGGAGRQAPPAAVTQGLAPGTHTFGNGQTWRKNADGSMTYVSGGQ